jgi:HD-GYP domain-containing protein (c-di-GMP phosphodiesterase class II)
MHNRGQSMQLVPINIESIQIGKPLPFPLMDKDGVLLAKKSFVVASKGDLLEISERGGGLYIDVADSELQHRAYVDRLYGLVRDEKSLGEIADTKITPTNLPQRKAMDDDKPDWLDLLVQCNTLLRDQRRENFLERLDFIYEQIHRQALRNPDGTLFALIYISASEQRMYSATHAVLTSVMCGLAARDVLNWPPEVEALLCKASLTMNLGMSELQDRLASQKEAPTAPQRAVIDAHPAKSVEILQSVGVADSRWLQAVLEHHTQQPGPLAAREPGQRMARLIQRADMFGARLAPRASRVPTAPAAAMQACYFDENRQVDEAGAALIKAVGIYQPGSFVRLATDEVAIVIKRGRNTTTPRVAVLINRSGMATVEPTIRDTSLKEYKIVASVPHREVKVQVHLQKILPLTLGPPVGQQW